MPYSYVTVTTLKGTGGLNISGTAFDTRLRQITEHVSQQIDRTVNRIFHPRTLTLELDGDGSTLLMVPDLVSVTSLKEDTNEDGTFETTWASVDYLLKPNTARPTADYGSPYTYLQVNPRSDGTQDEFLKGPKMYELIGTFGYSRVLGTSLPKTSGTWGGAGTTSLLASTVGIEPGMTILVDSEQIYVESTATTTLTVQRAMNGSTAATHTGTTTIQYYLYPGQVEAAVFIQTS